MTARHVALLVSCVVGCGVGSAPPSPDPIARSGSLPEGIVARVGESDVSMTTVARIAAAQALAPPQALSLAVRDAVFENEAARRGVAPRSIVSAALARATLKSLVVEAEQQGPVTDAELGDTTAEHWLELDRPAGYRTVHAVVRLDDRADAAKRAAAADVAAAIHRAVEPVRAMAASTPRPERAASRARIEDAAVAPFKLAVGSVPHQGLEVITEELPPVSADARVLSPEGSRFDPDFARAAAALDQRGQLSPPVVSAFGIHVIMLLEKTPERFPSKDERLALLTPEIMSRRARRLEQALLAPARESAEVDLSADALLALVSIAP